MQLRSTLLTLNLAVAEAALLMSFFGILTPLAWLWPGFFVMIGVLLAIALGWQWLAQRGIAPQSQMFIISVSFVGLWSAMLALLAFADNDFRLGFVSGLVSLLIALVVWWRGIALGQFNPNPRHIRDRIVIAICVLSLLGFFNILARNSQMSGLIMIVFGALVLALPQAHLHSIALSPIGRKIANERDYWRWVGPNVFFAAMACLLTAFIFNQDWARQVLAWLLTAIFGLFAIVLLPILQPVVEVLLALLRFFNIGSILSQIPALTPPPIPTDPNALAENAIVIPPVITSLITVAILLALGGGIIVLTGVARRERVEAGPRSEPESVPYEAPKTSSTLDQIKQTLNLRRWLAAITVRHLYARMTHEAAKRGQPRPKYQTAYDFLPALDRAFPNHAAESRLLTDAYVAAHYGELPDSPDAIVALKVAWQNMRKS
ncbi:MAG: DUF4129 domain-containing protein [Anaerolineae bacterium]|nr:DUF4129 domain-containing protein [Anaerolineae bacterium]